MTSGLFQIRISYTWDYYWIFLSFDKTFHSIDAMNKHLKYLLMQGL